MRGLIVVFAFALAGCAPDELPPPARPAQDLPLALPAAPPPDGRGYVVVDTPEGSSSVSHIIGHGHGVTPRGQTVIVDSEEDICTTTPCVVDLKRGSQTLVVSTDLDRAKIPITVGNEPVVVRHLYEQTRRGDGYVSGLIFSIVGSSLLLPATILTIVGLSQPATVPGEDGTNTANPARTIGYVGIAVLAVAAATTIASGVVLWSARGTHRPGATTIFSTSPSAPSVP